MVELPFHEEILLQPGESPAPRYQGAERILPTVERNLAAVSISNQSESVSTSERQDEEQMPRETGTRQGIGLPTGDPHRGRAEDPPPEGRATQGTHTEHTQTEST